jgi:hypothetical protein
MWVLAVASAAAAGTADVAAAARAVAQAVAYVAWSQTAARVLAWAPA